MQIRRKFKTTDQGGKGENLKLNEKAKIPADPFFGLLTNFDYIEHDERTAEQDKELLNLLVCNGTRLRINQLPVWNLSAEDAPCAREWIWPEFQRQNFSPISQLYCEQMDSFSRPSVAVKMEIEIAMCVCMWHGCLSSSGMFFPLLPSIRSFRFPV